MLQQGLKKMSEANPYESRTSLIANKVELETFYKTLFRHTQTGYISIRGFFSSNEIAFNEFYKFDDPQLISSLERLATKAANMEKVVFCPPICTFLTNQKADQKNIANGLTISVDLDDCDPTIGREVLETILGPPTIVVASGGKWKNINSGESLSRIHLHWRLISPTTSLTDHERLKKIRKMLTSIAKGDSSGVPICHPFRWPGSWHTKGEPILCRILEINEDTELSLSEIEARLGEYSAKQQTKTNNYKETFQEFNFTNEPLSNDLKAHYEREKFRLFQAKENERNTTLNAVAYHLGKLIGGGLLNQVEVEAELLKIATFIGLGSKESKTTMRSGLEAGIEKPQTHFYTKGMTQDQFDMDWRTKLKSGADILKLDVKVEWLINGIIPKKSVTLFFGRGGIGKTTLSLMLCRAISEGKPFLGIASKQTKVIYLDYENSLPVLKQRLQTIGCNEVLFFSSSDSPPKLDVSPIPFMEMIDAYPESVFIIDTLRSAQGADENDSRAMAQVMGVARNLRDNGATVIILHHTPKGADNKYKGSTAIFDLVDHVIGLYPLTTQKNQETANNKYYFGTVDKTRYKPFDMPLQFSKELGLFTNTEDISTSILFKIQKLIQPEGINQTELISKMKSELDIGKSQGLELLKKGEDSHWKVERQSKNNSLIYTPFSGFRNP